MGLMLHFCMLLGALFAASNAFESCIPLVNTSCHQDVQTSSLLVCSNEGLNYPPCVLPSNPVYLQLDLSRNMLTVITNASFVGQGYQILISLNIANNALTMIGVGALSSLFALQDLDLSGNQIATLPVGFLNSSNSFSTVNLSSNQITHLTANLFYQANILTLNLGQNSITVSDPLAFASAKILSLTMDDNKMTLFYFNSLGSAEIIELYIRNNLLSTLNFNNSGLSHLQILSVANNLLDELTASTFNNLPSLISLDLSGNTLRHLKPGFLGSIPSILSLFLNHTRIAYLPPAPFAAMPALIEVELSFIPMLALQPGLFSGVGPAAILYLVGLNPENISSLAFGNVPTYICGETYPGSVCQANACNRMCGVNATCFLENTLSTNVTLDCVGAWGPRQNFDVILSVVIAFSALIGLVLLVVLQRYIRNRIRKNKQRQEYEPLLPEEAVISS